jgi:hypothetical protein
MERLGLIGGGAAEPAELARRAALQQVEEDGGKGQGVERGKIRVVESEGGCE